MAKATARNRGSLLTPRKKAPPPLRLAAEQTFDDDWKPPAPEPAREDPRRGCAPCSARPPLSLEGRDAPTARPAPAPASEPEDDDEPESR